MFDKLGKDFTRSVNLLAQVLDVVGINLISFLIYGLYLGTFDLTKLYLQAHILSSVLLLFFFSNFEIYLSWRGKSKFKRFGKITTAWLLVVGILILTSAVLKNTNHYSRVWFFSWITTSLIYLIGYRYLLDITLNILRKKGWNHKNIIIFGAGNLGSNVGSRINAAEWTGFSIKAYFDDNKAVVGKTLQSAPILDTSEIEEFISKNDIKELWIAIPLKSEERVKEILHNLRHLSISIRFIPNIFGFRLLNQNVSEIAGIPVLQLNGSPIHGMNRLLKEIEDKLIATIIIILISPILLVVAIAIKLESKGPVIFKQIRNGWDGKEINVYKFRSMFVHAEEGNKITQASKNDKRITKVGAFIRKTSLDELPQFLNVLQGRMSIVGPRPHVVSQNEEYKDQVDHYMQRHRVKPGITGWAQVNGFRGETDTLEKMSKRVEFDLYYIENWSVWFDIKIIILTVFKGFINENAY